MGRVGASRNPRYSRFILVGAVLGVLLGLLVVAVRQPTGASEGQIVVYTALICAVLGGMLGGVVAVALDRG